MAKTVLTRKVASNPHGKRNSNMTAAQKNAFVARMNKARKAKKNGKRKNPTTTAARKNPSNKKANGHRKNPGTRRNPNFLADPKGIVVNIITALLAAVGTRQIPQWLLGVNNTGWSGYLANIGTTIAATFAAGEFVSAGAGQAAMIGGGVIVLDRFLTEQFSPVGKYLSLTGLGDATAATSLGTVSDGFYLHPTIYQANGQPLIPHEVTDAAVRAFNLLQAAPAPAGAPSRAMVPATPAMAGAARNRFASRF